MPLPQLLDFRMRFGRQELWYAEQRMNAEQTAAQNEREAKDDFGVHGKLFLSRLKCLLQLASFL